MPPPIDPAQITPPELRELALQAAWVAQLEEAMEVLEDMVVDLSDDEEDVNPADEDPLVVALSVVQEAYEDADRALEERAIAWLAADPEHWPIFRLVVLDPGRRSRGGGGRGRRGGPGR